MSNIDIAKAQLEEGRFDIKKNSSSSSDDKDEEEDFGVEEISNRSKASLLGCAERKKAESTSSSEEVESQSIPPPSHEDTDDAHGHCLKDLKPVLQKGDKVWAAWWNLAKDEIINTAGALWFEGKVHATKEVNRCGNSRASEYGPLRLYDIHFNDGDKLKGVLDVFVCPEKDYNLQTKIKRKHWKGVRNVVDKKSSDRYAREIGWYNVVAVDGQEISYSTLYEAMKKSDEVTIEKKKGDVRKSDLNLPNEFKLPKKKRERPNDADDLSQSSTGDLPLIFMKSKRRRSTSPFRETSTRTSSDYKGVEHNQRQEKHWSTKIFYNGKNCFVGVYDLESDAARVYDEVTAILNVPIDDPNFASEIDHKQARKREAETLGLSLESIDSVEASLMKAQIYVNNLLSGAGNDGCRISRAPSVFIPVSTERKKRSTIPLVKNARSSSEILIDLNDEMTKKWGMRLPAAGNLFLESYQCNLEKMLACCKGKSSSNTPIETIVLTSTAQAANAPEDQREELDSGENHQITDYMGITKVKRGEKRTDRFRGTVYFDGKYKGAGDYVLRADAAHARDELCRSFNLNKPLNFNTEQEYEIARAKEIEKRRLTLDAADTEAKRKDVISLSEVASRIQAKKANWEEENRLRNADADDLPQNYEPFKPQSHPTSQGDHSDDDTLFSETKEEQEKFAQSQDSAAITVTASNTTTASGKPQSPEMNLVSVTKDQEASLEFPLGCRVLLKLQDESFQRGVITSAWLDMNPPVNLLYEVEPINGESKQKKTAAELAFDTRCPIHFISSSDNNLVEGEVLFSRTDCTSSLYTIILKKEGNEFEIMHDVPANLVKFRKIEKENSRPSDQTETNSTKKDQDKQWNPGEHEVNWQFETASNSTISTRDSTRVSTPRGRGHCDNGTRWDECSIVIRLPHWFVSDNAMKDHLRCKFF